MNNRSTVLYQDKIAQPAESSLDTRCLFRSFKLGKRYMRNRIVMAPMTRGFSPGGIPGANVAAYYRRRAVGEVGLIISEGTYPPCDSAQGYPDVPTFADRALPGWKNVIDSVHAAGGLMVPQLWHTGSFRKPGFDRGNRIVRIAPSAVPHPGYTDEISKVVPVRMSEEEIADTIESYALAAQHAGELGFDGVEIHGAHGYLIDQFFWAATNRRLDRWGGSLRDRTRFACAVVTAVRDRVGPDFPIIFRFSNWKLGTYDERGKIVHSPNELEQLLAPLAAAGVDIFHASTRNFDSAEFPGSTLSLAGWTKKITGLPVITVGSVALTSDFIAERQGQAVRQNSLDRLIQRMNNEEFDLVAVGRSLLADAQWTYKIRHHLFDSIVPYDKSCLLKLY